MIADVQIIKQNDVPVFAVIPFAQYEEMRRRLAVTENLDAKIKFPLEVAEMNALKGYSLIKAWRIYRGKTQKEVAAAMGITQGAFSQIEKSARNQGETLRRVAAALDIKPEQLTLDD